MYMYIFYNQPSILILSDFFPFPQWFFIKFLIYDIDDDDDGEVLRKVVGKKGFKKRGY